MGILAQQRYGVTAKDVLDSGGINVRYWLPPTTNSGVLVIWCHQHTGTEAIAPGAFSYPIVHACIQEGWMVAASRMHGDSWGNASALTDLQNLVTLMNGIRPVTKVILVGASMGGAAVSNAVAAGTLANVKAAVSLDAVYDLANMYANASYTASIDTAWGITRGTLSGATTAGATSIPTTASFPTIGTKLLVGNGTVNSETVTTTGASTGTAVAVTALVNAHASAEQISDYSQKLSGNNPILRTAAAYGTMPWRFYVSNSDTAVPRASHGDAMAAKVAATAPEAVVNTHVAGHLSGAGMWPGDIVAYIKRRL